jgi:hypothetical protein
VCGDERHVFRRVVRGVGCCAKAKNKYSWLKKFFGAVVTTGCCFKFYFKIEAAESVVSFSFVCLFVTLTPLTRLTCEHKRPRGPAPRGPV